MIRYAVIEDDSVGVGWMFPYDMKMTSHYKDTAVSGESNL